MSSGRGGHGPQRGGLVCAGREEGELCGVPAALDHFVRVFRDADAAQGLRQITCEKKKKMATLIPGWRHSLGLYRNSSFLKNPNVVFITIVL